MVFQSFRYRVSSDGTIGSAITSVVSFPFSLKAKYNKIFIKKIVVQAFTDDNLLTRSQKTLAIIKQLPGATKNIAIGAPTITNIPNSSANAYEVEGFILPSDGTGSYFDGNLLITNDFEIDVYLADRISPSISDMFNFYISIAYDV